MRRDVFQEESPAYGERKTINVVGRLEPSEHLNGAVFNRYAGAISKAKRALFFRFHSIDGARQ